MANDHQIQGLDTKALVDKSLDQLHRGRDLTIYLTYDFFDACLLRLTLAIEADARTLLRGDNQILQGRFVARPGGDSLVLVLLHTRGSHRNRLCDAPPEPADMHLLQGRECRDNLLPVVEAIGILNPLPEDVGDLLTLGRLFHHDQGPPGQEIDKEIGLHASGAGGRGHDADLLNLARGAVRIQVNETDTLHRVAKKLDAERHGSVSPFGQSHRDRRKDIDDTTASRELTRQINPVYPFESIVDQPVGNLIGGQVLINL